MTRKEQIEVAAEEICKQMIVGTVNSRDVFIAGAEWADENPYMLKKCPIPENCSICSES